MFESRRMLMIWAPCRWCTRPANRETNQAWRWKHWTKLEIETCLLIWGENFCKSIEIYKSGINLSRRVTAGVKRVHDVSEQAAFGMLPWQGALLPRRDHFSQCPHPGKSNNQMWRSIVKWMLLYFAGTTQVLFIAKWGMAHALAFNWNLITIACIPRSLHVTSLK